MFSKLCRIFESDASKPIALSPSTLRLAYYPIKVVLSEWTYTMHEYNKLYEYTFESAARRINDLHNEDVAELHRWRRRCQQSCHKLAMVKAFVKHWKGQGHDAAQVDLLLLDIAPLLSEVSQFGRLLELQATMVMSVVQLLDARKSITEAVSVRHLTLIALIFIPLAFVSSLFSMTEDYAPGKRNFKVYWETALPVLAVVLTLSYGFSTRGRNFLRALDQTGKTARSAQTITTAKSWLRSKQHPARLIATRILI